MRTDGAALYPVGNARVEATREDRRSFYESDQFIILITSSSGGPRLDSRRGLRFLSDLHTALAAVEGVFGGRVRSLATLIDPRPGESVITSANFLDEIPTEESSHAAFLERIDASPLAHGLFLSPSGRAATVYVPVLRDARRDQVAVAMQDVLNENNAEFDLRMTGPTAVEVMLGRAVLRDLIRLVPIMVAVMAVLTFACLQSFGYVLIALCEVLLVLIATLGAMGLAGVPVTLVTTILPVLVMAVAISDEIHLLDRFRTHLASQAAPPRAGEAIQRALQEVARPIVLTSLTTSIGFLSFLSASVIPLRHFGTFAAIGVLLAMVMSFTFVPAMVVLLPVSWFTSQRSERVALHEQRPPAQERLVARHAAAAALLGAFVLLAAIPGGSRLSVHDSWVENFDPAADVVTAERDFNREFWGSYRFDIVLESSEPLFFHRAQGLRLVNSIEELAASAPHVGGVASHRIAFQIVADVGGLATPVYDLPESTVRRIALLLNRVQRKTDMDQLLGVDGSRARVRLFVKSADYHRAAELFAFLEANLPSRLEGTDLQFHFSGDLPIAQAVVGSIVENTLRSAGWTVVGVFFLLVLFLRSPYQAAITLIPLTGGTLVILGFMGYSGMPLGVATSMFVAVMIGVAVDFAIHFGHAYLEHRHQDLAHEKALLATFATTGRALRWNAFILGSGLFVLGFSTLRPNRDLGLLLSGAITACYVMTLLLLPRLIRRFNLTHGAESPISSSLG